METSLDIATMVGGYAVAVSAVILAWWSLHWQAIRRREVGLASIFELALLLVFALVVTAWIINTPWR